MKAVLLLCIAAVAFAAITSDNADVAFKFQEWMATYGKTYESNDAMEHAFENFKITLARLPELHKQHPRAQFGLNKFSDLSPEEFKAQYLTFKHPRADQIHYKPVQHVDALPDKWDWRDKKATTFPKDQEQCGSCWAFSAVESIESQWFLAGKKLVEFSPQQIVSCDKVDLGCQGGNTETAYEYVTKAGGIELDKDYPYTSGGGSTGTCRVKTDKFVGHINGYTHPVNPCITPGDKCQHQNETQLMEATYLKGPVSVCIYADPWQSYQGGILSGCSSEADKMDHCAQLVAYDHKDGIWIVRNSWGYNWGIMGYIYLAMKNNECGIANDVTLATIATH